MSSTPSPLADLSEPRRPSRAGKPPGTWKSYAIHLENVIDHYKEQLAAAQLEAWWLAAELHQLEVANAAQLRQP